MPRGTKIVFVICGAWFLCDVAFIVQPTPIIGWLALLTALGFVIACLVTVVRAFTQWKVHRIRALVPFVACLVAVLIAKPVGILIGDTLFWQWRLPHYETVIHRMEAGSIPVSARPNLMTPDEIGIDRVLAYVVFAQKDTNSLLTIAFVYGGAGPPPYHTAYLYCSSGVIESDSFFDHRYPYRRRMNNRWFKVSD